MALKAPKQAKKNDFPPQPEPEAGTYPARVVQILDLGLQPQRAYKGEAKKPANEVILTYEFVDTFMVDENGDDIEDKPRWYSESLPWFGADADRAKSAKRYHAFDPDNAYDGDLAQCIDTPVNVTIVLNKVGEKTYVNIAEVTSMRARDAAKCPELKNPAKVFDIDDPDMEIFKQLPEWIQNKMKENLNYAGSALEKAIGGGVVPKPEGKKAEAKKTAKAAVADEEEAYDANPAEADDRPW